MVTMECLVSATTVGLVPLTTAFGPAEAGFRVVSSAPTATTVAPGLSLTHHHHLRLAPRLRQGLRHRLGPTAWTLSAISAATTPTTSALVEPGTDRAISPKVLAASDWTPTRTRGGTAPTATTTLPVWDRGRIDVACTRQTEKTADRSSQTRRPQTRRIRIHVATGYLAILITTTVFGTGTLATHGQDQCTLRYLTSMGPPSCTG